MWNNKYSFNILLYKFLHINNLYLTYHPEVYRLDNSLTLEIRDNKKNQGWKIIDAMKYCIDHNNNVALYKSEKEKSIIVEQKSKDLQQ